MATGKNAKSKNNNTNLAARLSVPANGGTRFLEVLDEDRFILTLTDVTVFLVRTTMTLNMYLLVNTMIIIVNFTSTGNYQSTLMVLRELVRQYENKYFVTFTKIVSDI